MSYQIKSFFKKNWGWLMTVIIIPIWIYFFNQLKNLVKKKKTIQNRLKAEISKINPENITSFKEKIYEFIQRDEIKTAINELIEFSNLNKANELKNQITLISSRFNSNESDNNLNIISNSEYNLNKSQITKGLLLLMDDIYEYGTQQGLKQ